MLDSVVEKLGKNASSRNLKLVIAQGPQHDDLYIVQSSFFKQRWLRPDRQTFIRSGRATAEKMVRKVSGLQPLDGEIVMIDNKSVYSTTYAFWFAPSDWTIEGREHLRGNILSVSELVKLKREWVRQQEGKIASELFVKAKEQRQSMLEAVST